MTIKEAEEFFKRYDGHPFHMGREEPSAYKEFSDMNIPKETKECWQQELIDALLKELSDKKAGFIVHRILDIIWEIETDIKRISEKDTFNNISLLLNTIDSLKDADRFEKILIIESLTERCGTIIGIGLGERLDITVERLSDIPMTDEEKAERLNMRWTLGETLGERYDSAVKRYRETYEYCRAYYADKSRY